MRIQNPGDKSGEVSLFDNDLEIASDDDNEDEISYGDDGVSYGNNSNGDSVGSLSDGDIDSMHNVDTDDIFTNPPTNHENENGHLHADIGSRPSSAKPQDFCQDTEVLVQDLLQKFESSNQISYDELQNSLLDLNMKWETILEQTVYDTDQQINTTMQERNDIELELNHLKRVHEDELDAVKSEVMEQSQKIIRQELKVNAERERQFEEEKEIAVTQAINKCKEEMQEEFDILLSGMKDSEKELKEKYERLLKDTEVRIRDEVFAEAHRASKNETEIVVAQFEEMKKQLVDVTMELTTFQADSERKVEDLNQSIEEKSNKIKSLKDDMDHASTAYEGELNVMRAKIDEQNSIISIKDEERSNALREVDEQKNNEIEKLKEEFGKNVRNIKDESDAALENLKRRHEEELIETRSEIARYKSLLTQKDAEKTLLEQVIHADFEETVKDLKAAHENEMSELRHQVDENIQSLENANTLGRQMKSLLESEKAKIVEMREEYDSRIDMMGQKHTDELNNLRESLEIEKTQSCNELNTKLSEEMGDKVSLERKYEDTISQLKSVHENELQQLEKEKVVILTKIESLSSKEKESRESLELNHKEAIEQMTEEHESELKDITEAFAQEKVEVLAEAESEICRLQNENEELRAEANAQKEQLRRDLITDGDIRVKEVTQSMQYLEEKLKGLESMLSEEKSSKILLQRQHDEIIAGLKSDLDTQLVRLKGSFAQEKAELLAEAKAEIDHLRIQNEALTGALQNSKSSVGKVQPPHEIQLNRDVHGDMELKNSSTLQSVNESINDSVDYKAIEICSLDGHSHSARSIGSEHLRPAPSPMSKNMSPLTMSSPQPRKFSATKPKQVIRPTSSSGRSKSTVQTGILRSGQNGYNKIYTAPPLFKSTKRNTKVGAYTSPTAKDSTLATFAPPESEDVRLLILIPITERMKKMAHSLKIGIVEGVLDATHVIAGDSKRSLRRTAKLMAALCITSNILKAEWLEESFRSRGLLSCNHYLLLNDAKAESVYSFSMRTTLREGNERRTAGGLLHGWSVYVCDEVAGNKAPKTDELKMMIYAAGGKWITHDDIPVPITDDPTHVIVLTSDPPLQSQLDDTHAQIAADNGAGFFTTSWLFDCMMHQKLFGIKRGLGRM